MNHIQYNNMTSTTNPFDNLCADKDFHATERSLRAHKGVLTKLTCYIDTAVNAVNVLPTAKGCIELEQLKEKMEWKIAVSYTHLTLPTICSV